MPETITQETSKHVKHESLFDRFRMERHKGRRRAAGRGVMALISRMHITGMHGRHAEGGPFAPNKSGVRSAEIGQAHIAQGRAAVENAPAPARAAVEAKPFVPIVPEASDIRPEIPAEAVPASPPAEYVGAHRAPETPEETAFAEAQMFALPAEAHRDPDAWQTNHIDVEPVSHSSTEIAGSSWWGLPGIRVEAPAAQPLHQGGPELPAAEVQTPAHPAESQSSWFGGSNTRRPS